MLPDITAGDAFERRVRIAELLSFEISLVVQAVLRERPLKLRNGYCKKGEDVTVRLRGGDLLVRYTNEGVFMTGDARKNFEGVVEL